MTNAIVKKKWGLLPLYSALQQVQFVLQASSLAEAQLSRRKPSIDSLLSQSLSHCRTIMRWFVKITRGRWEGNGWGEGLCFTNISSKLQVFFIFSVPEDKPHLWPTSDFTPPSQYIIWTNCCPWLVTGSFLFLWLTQLVILTQIGRIYRQLIMDIHTIYIAESTGLFLPSAVPQLSWTFSVVSTLGESICQVGGGLPAAH